MIRYSFSVQQPAQQYIQITTEFPTPNNEIQLHLPSWRPGRYELGNFAKNIRNFKVFNGNGQKLTAEKTSKDSWKVDTSNTQSIKVQYLYYASELNAGSTYVSKEQLYVNPVNCCLYAEGFEDEACELTLQVPSHFEWACPLPHENWTCFAKNFDQLADSPFIASSQLQHDAYEVNGILFHLWFNGEVKVDWDRLKADFGAFTAKQFEKFTEFPAADYHFLFQIVPYKAYHGVEHHNSTVILLGPSFDIFEGFYKELLGVSSHELYHTWNVKAIRPIEMYPYDFKRENYSRLGYLCEGVTTYMGDLFLYKSGVFTFEQYAAEFGAQVQKHFDNFGRFNYSVADSSFDTWLDGYVPGAPHRKVSIYTEGCLLAFVTDVFIRKNSKDKYGLDDVMKHLYFQFYLANKGVSEAAYLASIEQFAGASFQSIYDDYFNGTKPYESILVESLDYIGLSLEHRPSSKYSAARLGFKALPQGMNAVVKAIYPGSPAELAGLMLEDELLAVNSFQINGELDAWLRHFDDDVKTLTVARKGRIIEVTLPEVNRFFYLEYGISVASEPTHAQKRAFQHWSN